MIARNYNSPIIIQRKPLRQAASASYHSQYAQHPELNWNNNTDDGWMGTLDLRRSPHAACNDVVNWKKGPNPEFMLRESAATASERLWLIPSFCSPLCLARSHPSLRPSLSCGIVGFRARRSGVHASMCIKCLSGGFRKGIGPNGREYSLASSRPLRGFQMKYIQAGK